MEDEVSCDDPQFMNMLETCLRVEIETANNTLKSLENEIKDYKGKVQLQLQTRKEIKEKIRNSQENSLILTDSLNKYIHYKINIKSLDVTSNQFTIFFHRQNRQINEIFEKIGLVKLNLDNDYKIIEQERERHENILKEYEVTWKTYRAKYEEYPLAKVRQEARIKLERLLVDGMVVAHKIEELEKILKQSDHVTWLRLREKIVELARAVSNNAQLRQTLQDLNKTIAHRKEELNAIDKELARRMKMKEEERKARALKLLEMPPPKINFSYVRGIYGNKPKTSFLEGWKRNYENSIDTLSVDTITLEEMCSAEDTAIGKRPRNQDHDLTIRKERSSSTAIDDNSPSPEQDQEEMEREEAASEPDENVEPEVIGGPLEEVEHRDEEEVDQERSEEALCRSSVHEDKQTVEGGEDRVEQGRDPPSKRMKLISEEDKARASPAASLKGSRSQGKRSQLAGPSPRPKITNIESVRYNLSPIAKPANPNPSNMFTSGHYNYSDNSNFSFCVDNNLADLKVDQVSLYGGSVHEFCEYSNVTPIRNLEANPEEHENANLPSTSKPQNFPRNYGDSITLFLTEFDFSNILKGNMNRNLF
ncbi:LOW QUALITY PROTEIN: uncharacterized protein LOC143184765 [Calliopsis andreniformis]|uniref:LOW QUALITY PROTEIN: uncharacterized protein LOC143184765 n=1 Tax=Calliopsis andreniformis TaxID=337506 RepID=UPI003FCCE58C